MFTHSPTTQAEIHNASANTTGNNTVLSELSYSILNASSGALNPVNGSSPDIVSNNNNHDHAFSDVVNVYSNNTPVRQFPLPLVVASSVAAVSILIFFCVAYYWHSYQLDKRAQLLAIQRAAEDAEAQVRPRRRSRHSRMKQHSGRSTELPSPTANGPVKSTAASDKEILTHFASRRQSIFF